MRNNISPETLDAIAALGFDVYQSSDPRWQSYLFFTDGDKIGYFENDRLSGWTISTVHIPNRTTGTGFSLRDTLPGPVELTRECLTKAFMTAPAWASDAMRASVAKWPSVASFLKERSAGRFVLVREGAK